MKCFERIIHLYFQEDYEIIVYLVFPFIIRLIFCKLIEIEKENLHVL
jgi:hypothetical protein